MTEFRKFSAALDDAKLTLQTAAATDNSDSATARRDAAEAIRRRCADGDLRRTADKFAAKLEATDDVTEPTFRRDAPDGAPRPGRGGGARPRGGRGRRGGPRGALRRSWWRLITAHPRRSRSRATAPLRAKVAACVEMKVHPIALHEVISRRRRPCWLGRAVRVATPSSRRRVDGVEADATNAS